MSMYRCDTPCPSNEELALRIRDGDPQAAPLLLSQNEGYLTMLATSYCEQFSQDFLVDDLKQEGALALLDAARRVADGRTDLTAMAALPDDALLERLQTIHGVGVKVASCVMLFGYPRLASAPVDVWIRRVIDEDYGGRSPFPAYGEHTGIFQQYLF